MIGLQDSCYYLNSGFKIISVILLMSLPVHATTLQMQGTVGYVDQDIFGSWPTLSAGDDFTAILEWDELLSATFSNPSEARYDNLGDGISGSIVFGDFGLETISSNYNYDENGIVIRNDSGGGPSSQDEFFFGFADVTTINWEPSNQLWWSMSMISESDNSPSGPFNSTVLPSASEVVAAYESGDLEYIYMRIVKSAPGTSQDRIGFFVSSMSAIDVPEPNSLTIMTLGLVGLGYWRKKQDG